jgi:hypothetical protein
LLKVAGVDSVAELARRTPDNPHVKSLQANAPSLKEVTSWIAQAQMDERAVLH